MVSALLRVSLNDLQLETDSYFENHLTRILAARNKTQKSTWSLPSRVRVSMHVRTRSIGTELGNFGSRQFTILNLQMSKRASERQGGGGGKGRKKETLAELSTEASI